MLPVYSTVSGCDSRIRIRMDFVGGVDRLSGKELDYCSNLLTICDDSNTTNDTRHAAPNSRLVQHGKNFPPIDSSCLVEETCCISNFSLPTI